VDRPRCIPRNRRHDADSRRDRETTAVNRLPSPAGPIQTDAPEPGSQASETSGSISGAWIAGVAAGPLVAGIALAGFSPFWWGRRRGRKEAGPKPNPATSEQELQQHVPARSGYQHQQYPPHGEGVDPATPGSAPLPKPLIGDQEQDASYVNCTSSPLIGSGSVSPPNSVSDNA